MAAKQAINYQLKKHSKKFLREVYQSLLLPRMIEERMLLLLRQGKLSKWFSGIGQEAIAVGATMALSEDEYVLPLHRNLGVFTTRALPLDLLFCQLLGKAKGITGGRDRTFHFGTKDHRIVGMISHLGAQLAVADGIALSHRLRKEKKVTLAFTGEGGTSEGDFHESLNLASVWDLPVIFLIENNSYALSTTTDEQYRCEQLADRAKGYGIEGIRIDGNNVLDVYEQVSALAKQLRSKPRPVLLECMTFRVRGHEEASGVKYVPPKLIKQWTKKDPVLRYEEFLLDKKVIDSDFVQSLKGEISARIESALEYALEEQAPVANAERELEGVFAPVVVPANKPSKSSLKKRYIDAISDALQVAMKKHDELVLMGQDIAGYGGVFKVTEGFVDKFGKNRVRNTPICESAVIGAALGLSIQGFKSVVEMQFADFVSCAFNQIVNNLAKAHYRWGHAADVVVRMPSGGGVAAGPFHSQSIESWFTHVPGLKVVCPAFPADAKGLLLSAIEDRNPVIFFEHKKLYRGIEGEVPKGQHYLELGKANLVREGKDLSIVTYGLGVHWALEFLDANPEVSADLIDLRTLVPLDFQLIEQSLKKTSRALVLSEATYTGSFAAEIAALIAERCFELLDAPVVRCGSLDTPIPFAPSLEQEFLAQRRLEEQVRNLLSY